MVTQTTDFPSQYHNWFTEMGYPELDFLQYSDGEWYLIQYFNAPTIPSLTKWQVVLGPMRNIVPTRGFCEKFVKQCDMNRKEFWARENRKSKEVEDEHDRGEKHSEDLVNRAHQAFMRNPNVLDRIAKNGVQEMSLAKIAKHVPKSSWYKPKIKPVAKETPNVFDTSQPVHETISS